MYTDFSTLSLDKRFPRLENTNSYLDSTYEFVFSKRRKTTARNIARAPYNN